MPPISLLPSPAFPVPASACDLPDPLAILDSIGEAVYSWDIASDRLRWSPNATALLGCDDADAVGTGAGFHERTAATSEFSRLDAILGDGRTDGGSGVPFQIRYGLTKDAGGRPEVLWIDDTGRWFAGSDGRPASAHGLVRVSAGRAASEAPLLPSADPMTGCQSRAHLLGAIGALLERPTSGGGFAVLLMQVEDLSALNIRHGYDAVDELLAGLARNLRTQIRSADCLSRYGGSRFALLLAGCDAGQIAPAAARTLDLLTGAPVDTSAGPLATRVRIGGVLAPRQGRTARALLLSAEAALREATDAEPFRLFDPASHRCDDERRLSETADEIVAALNDGRVRIATQPIVAGRTGEMAMGEALLRILGEDGQIFDPPALLPAADKAGLTALLDRRVLDLAVAHLRGTDDVLTLNVSAATLHDRDWPGHVAALLRLHPDVAGRIVFEIGEEVAAADLAASRQAIVALRTLGARVAIDHFGAGHASFQTLRELRPDFLKLDGAFVQNLQRSPDDRFLVRSLVALARQIGAPVIAEWVESATVATTLEGWGVQFMQGSYFGMPDLQDPRVNFSRAAVA